MAISVALFNASSQPITISVNNGPQVTVNGTGATQGWQPQTQSSGTGPSYSPGQPAPNVVGQQGRNVLQAFVHGAPVGDGPFVFSLPNNYPVQSVQISLFFASLYSASWMILTDGRVCAQSVGFSQIASPELEHTIAHGTGD